MSAPRPGTAALVCWLLGGAAAAHLVTAIGTFFAVPEIGWAYAERAGDDTAAVLPVAGAVLLGLGSLLVAALFAGLAVLNHLRPAASRVLTWAATVLVCAAGIPFLAVFGYHAVPWYRRLAVTAGWLALALTAGVALLLALPAARRAARLRVASPAGAAEGAARPARRDLRAALARRYRPAPASQRSPEPGGRRWNGRLVAGAAGAVVLLLGAVAAVSWWPGGGGGGAPTAAPGYRSVSGMCGRIAPSPVDFFAHPSALVNRAPGGAGTTGASGLWQQTCKYEAKSGTFVALLHVHAAVAGTADQARRLYDVMARGVPADDLVPAWPQAHRALTGSAAGTDVTITVRDDNLLLVVRSAVNGLGADEDRQFTAVAETAAEVREMLRR
ncbi:hypothetical protein ABNF97_11700 [Plantactinospora sp. B6F1]|uniref:hypothetical protein n=1 Tax=Plantactinospora sp. B6F1 TaxID=3158971 RepID=UPI0032D92593